MLIENNNNNTNDNKKKLIDDANYLIKCGYEVKILSPKQSPK